MRRSFTATALATVLSLGAVGAQAQSDEARDAIREVVKAINPEVEAEVETTTEADLRQRELEEREERLDRREARLESRLERRADRRSDRVESRDTNAGGWDNRRDWDAAYVADHVRDPLNTLDNRRDKRAGLREQRAEARQERWGTEPQGWNAPNAGNVWSAPSTGAAVQAKGWVDTNGDGLVDTCYR